MKTRRRIILLLYAVILPLMSWAQFFLLADVPRNFVAFMVFAVVNGLCCGVPMMLCYRLECPRCERRLLGLGLGLLYWLVANRCSYCGLRFSNRGALNYDEMMRLNRWLAVTSPRGPIPADVPIGCPRCDYRLSGLTADRCPECGTTFTDEELVNKAAGLGIRTSSRVKARRRDD